MILQVLYRITYQVEILTSGEIKITKYDKISNKYQDKKEIDLKASSSIFSLLLI